MFTVESLPSWQLAYIAGIIDGEGTIYISRVTKGMHLRPEVGVAMTDLACISTLYNITGIGNTGTCIRKGTSYKPVHHWRVRGRLEIYLLLKAIYPYLITKKKQADVLLKFIERRIQDCAQDSYDVQLCNELTALNK